MLKIVSNDTIFTKFIQDIIIVLYRIKNIPDYILLSVAAKGLIWDQRRKKQFWLQIKSGNFYFLFWTLFLKECCLHHDWTCPFGINHYQVNLLNPLYYQD